MAGRGPVAVVTAVLFLVLSGGMLMANELFDRGAQAFLHDRPREAAPLLEQAIGEDPVNARAYLYLALSYEQLAMYERAITTLQRAESIPGIDRSQVHFNIGNNYLHLGDAARAEDAYTEAIEMSPLSADPYLNRANVRVMQELYPTAVEDYTAVLGLEPEHAQRGEIERMIALLTDHLEQERIHQEEEARRIEDEERQRAIEDAQRLAEEERQRLEAEARRRALLDNVLDSLKTATDDTTNMSAGSEDIDDYEDEEFDIAD
ncbi:MAG: tetratricopeptide repeat protein [Spirochaetales bacterium]|nr:tetratricopeptide repeat protein [Spirochaetales bacterium]